MLKLHSFKKHLVLEVLLMTTIVIWFCFWAINLTTSPSIMGAPDEGMRLMVPRYIHTHHTLPSGYDNEVIYSLGNWSYAFYPQFLGPLVSSAFMDMVSVFYNDNHHLVIAARLASVVFGAASVFVLGKCIELIFYRNKYKKLYAYSAMIFLAFWPQFAYLSSYVNNDIVAFFGVTLIVYAALAGYLGDWTLRNRLIMAAGSTISILGYINSYGFVLIGLLFMVVDIWRRKKIIKKTVKLLVLPLLMIFVISAPFFMRNFLIYNGDLLGVSTFRQRSIEWQVDHQQKLQVNYFEKTGKGSLNILFDGEYWRDKIDSSIARFGYMNIVPSTSLLYLYKLLVIIGVSVATVHYIVDLWKSRHNKLNFSKKIQSIYILSFFIFSSLITILLSVYYSAKIDYQPQGRYIIYLLGPLLVAVIIGLNILLEKVKFSKLKIVFVSTLLIVYLVNTLAIFSFYLSKTG